LELFKNAKTLYARENTDEKREILKLLLSNIELDGKNIIFTLKNHLIHWFLYQMVLYGWGKGNSIEPRSAITIIHNVLISYECIYENYENILSILDKKKLDSREKTDFLL